MDPNSQVMPQPPISPTPQPIPPPPPKRNPWIMVSLVLFLALIGVGAYFFTKKPQQLTTNYPNPSPTPDPTANWKTYTNTSYNYSLKYPSDWKANSIEPGPGEVALNATSRGLALFPTVYQNSSVANVFIQLETDGSWNKAAGTYEQWLEKQKSPFFKVVKTNQIVFAGTSALEINGTYGDSTPGSNSYSNITAIYFPSSDKQTYFSITVVSKDPAYDEVVAQILSTFKFSTPTNKDILQTIKDLTQPMVWSATKEETTKNYSGQQLTGFSMTAPIPDKDQNKLAPLLASNSILTTTYGWTLNPNGSADGPTGGLITYEKTINNSKVFLIIRSDTSAKIYTVFISN